MTRIESLHKHVDNGGVTVEINYDFENGHTNINFDTSYYGYPMIRSTLSTWGTIPKGDSEFLRELGLMFLRASDKVDNIVKEILKQQGE